MTSPHDRDALSTSGTDRSKIRTKAAQIRSDQQTALDILARDLQDARTVRVERITANTLIRVAIDGLLAHAGRLHGDTETELRAAWLEFLDERKTGAGR